MKIKAHEGKVIPTSRTLRDVSNLPLKHCANIARAKVEFPEQFFDELCNTLGNPDLFFELQD